MDPKADDHFYAHRTTLGARLRWWRAQQAQTIENVATALGVSTATWGHWETGHSFPSGEMLLDLSRLTGLPLQVLFCPHLETCPFNEPGKAPVADIPCCQCGGSLAMPPVANPPA